GRLNAGVSVAQVTQSIYTSEEHYGQEVDGFYRTYLDRAADPSGREHWVGELQRGATQEQVMISFLSSDEYSQLHPGSEAFVNALSSDVLGRTYGQVRTTNLVGQLQSGTTTRAALAQDVVSSDESRLLVVDGFFSRFLRRAGDPGGRQVYLQRLQAGQTDAM